MFVTTIWAYKPNLRIIICLLPASTSQSSGLCCQQNMRLTVSWRLILPNISQRDSNQIKNRNYFWAVILDILCWIFLHRPWLTVASNHLPRPQRESPWGDSRWGRGKWLEATVPWLYNFMAHAKNYCNHSLDFVVSQNPINTFHRISIRRLNCSETDHRPVSDTVYVTKSG